MPSLKAVYEAFGMFSTIGCQGGPVAEEQVATAARIWVQVLADLSDADLQQGALAYLRDGKVCQFWPQPGAILARVPRVQAALIDDADEVFAKAMRYMIDHPKMWIHPDQGPNCRYFTADAIPGLVPLPLPAPPWTEEQAGAVERATAAIGGVEGWSYAEHDIPRSNAEATWKRAYRAARKQQALGIESGTVGQITSAPRQIERAP